MAFKKTFILSDESVNSYGFRIVTAGIDLTQAKKNLPAFYNHRTWDVPLGHWENLKVNDKGQLMGDLVIEGESESEKEYIRKVQNGDIKGASGGFDPVEWSEDTTLLQQGQTRPTLTRTVIFEASITPLPGNNNALALKTKEGLLSLSDSNSNQIIPSLKTEPDMKSIALKLGLPETATEQQILDAISKVQLTAGNADAMRLHIEAIAKDELPNDEAKALFVELAKTNFTQAVTFLNLNKKPAETAPAEAAPAATGKVQKDVKVSDLIQKGKESLSKKTDAELKDSFDYLQKHNPVELKRIHAEEPAKYTELAQGYANGIRYKA